MATMSLFVNLFGNCNKGTHKDAHNYPPPFSPTYSFIVHLRNITTIVDLFKQSYLLISSK